MVEMTKPELEQVAQCEQTLFVDRLLNVKKSGVREISEGLNDIILKYSLKFNFKVMNNQVEYKALITTLQLAKEIGARALSIRSDSQLIITQIKQEYKVKEPLLVKYVQITKRLLEDFGYDLQRILREKNSRANVLAKLANTKVAINNKMIIHETLQIPCIEKLMNIEDGELWMMLIIHYLEGEAIE